MKNTFFLFIASFILFEIGCSLPDPPPDYVGKFKDGYAPARMQSFWGIVDKDTNWVVHLEYDSIQEGSDGMFAVCKNKKWGFLDEQFKMSIDLRYDTVCPFYGGIALVFRSDSGWSFINKKGKMANIKFTRIEESTNRFYIISKMNDSNLYSKYAIVYKEKKQKQVSEWHSYVYALHNDNCVMIMDSAGWSMHSIDVGKISDYYNDYRTTSDPSLIIVQKGNKMALLNMNGKMVGGWYDQLGAAYTKSSQREKSVGMDDMVFSMFTLGVYSKHKHSSKETVEFTEYSSFSEGLMVVKKNGRYGYMDNTGKIIIPCKYSDAGDFKKGIAEVKENGKKKRINNKGEAVK